MVYRQAKYIIFLIAAILLLSGCTHVADVQPCLAGEPDGFWHGLLHGIIAPFAFIVSLFNDSITIYALNNNGRWYNFGFLLGASIVLGGSGSGARRRKK